ncbi:hypothetical protein D3C84_313080 [compost metagenome]
MEWRIAQHHVQRLRLLPRQAIARPHDHFAVTQGGLPVLCGGLHGHERLVHQRVLGLRIVQGAGDGQYTVAAPQVGDSRGAKVFRQMGEKRPRTDVQAFATEHVGMVEQFDGGFVERVTRRVRRWHNGSGLRGSNQQAGFLDGKGCLHRTDVAFQQVSRRPWQVFDHGGGHHLSAGCQLPLQANQLLFQQGKGLGNPDQDPVEWADQRSAGR